MSKKLQRILMFLFLSMFLGLIATHYLEGLETRLLFPLRNTILLGSNINQQNDDGIKLSQYKFTDQPQINPVHVAQQVRSETEKLFDNKNLTKEESENIITIADFLINYKEEYEYKEIQYTIWPYKFDYPAYQLESPWYSGMAQGLGLEVLLAAYELTGEDRYISEARLAANSLYVPINQGGVAIYINNGENGIWFEEYAQKDVQPPLVLNGHNFALLALEKLRYYDDSYSILYQQGINALIYKLPEFDAKVWSKYDLANSMANPKYHQIHINQLKYLGEQNDNEVFINYANKFTYQKYIPLGASYRLLFHPHNSIVICFVMNTIASFIVIILFKNKIRFRS